MAELLPKPTRLPAPPPQQPHDDEAHDNPRSHLLSQADQAVVKPAANSKPPRRGPCGRIWSFVTQMLSCIALVCGWVCTRVLDFVAERLHSFLMFIAPGVALLVALSIPVGMTMVAVHAHYSAVAIMTACFVPLWGVFCFLVSPVSQAGVKHPPASCSQHNATRTTGRPLTSSGRFPHGCHVPDVARRTRRGKDCAR